MFGFKGLTQMKAMKILGLTIILLTLITERLIADTTTQARVVRGELIYVLCASNVHIRSENLRDILFTTGSYERVSPFQGWGENKKSKIVNGQDYKFVKVQFQDNSNRPTDIGWVADSYVKLKSDCVGATTPRVSLADDTLSNIRGLEDPKCCLFPIEKHPNASYTTGARQFGASRVAKNGGVRKHAATDLYTKLYSNIVAVAPGRVLYSPIDFYMMTKEFAVQHKGGFVARYGEITPKRRARGIESGATVKTGQVIGYVGQTIWPDGSRRAPPMLHFELYSGTGKGSLSTKNAGPKRFYRRSDLMNPTKYMQRWENMTF